MRRVGRGRGDSRGSLVTAPWQGAHRRPGRQWKVWFLPFAVWWAVVFSPLFGLTKLVAAVFGLLFINWMSRRPGVALFVLVLLAPLQTTLFSLLYKYGAPVELLRALAAVKEALGAAVVLAGVKAYVREGRRLDRVDKVLLAYVIGVVLYYLFPFLLSASSAPTSGEVRLHGLRTNVAYLALFWGARHAPITPVWRRRIVGAFFVVVAFVALGGLWQFFDRDRWAEVIRVDIGLPQYQLDVLSLSRHDIRQGLGFLDDEPLRVGSVFVSAFTFGDFMLIGAAFAMAALTRYRSRAWPLPLAALTIAGILVSNTRAAVVGLAFATLVTIRPAPGKPSAGRIRFGLIVAAGLLVVVPGVLGGRFSGSEEADKSSDAHIDEFTTGLTRVIENPLGEGLGTSPDVGGRFERDVSTDQVFVSDNSVLQVGQELGAVMMVIFIMLLVVTAMALLRAPPVGLDDMLSSGSRAALLGLLAAGMFHHVFIPIESTWPLWALAGLGITRAYGWSYDGHGRASHPGRLTNRSGLR